MAQINHDQMFAVQFELAARKSLPDLIKAFSDGDITPHCYAYKSRIKSQDDLLEKVDRKVNRQNKIDYKVESITDVIGMRFVTLFKVEIPDIVERVFKLISEADSSSIFQDSVPEEIIVYSDTNPFDPLQDLIPQIAKRFFNEKIEVYSERSKEGYSSVHIVTRISEEVNVNGATKYVPLEIQIRTVFEDAWGEIDHKFGYVVREGKKQVIAVNNPEYVKLHLNVLKTFTDSCTQYADTIYSEALDTARNIGDGSVVSVDADEDLIQLLIRANVKEELIDRYVDGRSQKDAAIKSFKCNEPGAMTNLLSAAQLFNTLAADLDSILSSISDQQEDEITGYEQLKLYSKLNEAFCLLSTQNIDEIKVAYNVYVALEHFFPDYPFIQMRLGQTLGKLGKLDEAIHKLYKAQSMSYEIRKNNGEKWTLELPKADYEHLHDSLPIILGFLLWKKGEVTSEHNEKLQLYMRAYQETKVLLSTSESEHEKRLVHNNLLYYSLSYLLECTESDDCSDAEAVKEQLSSHLSELEKIVNIHDCKRPGVLDTFANAYIYVGENEKAKATAKLLLDIVLGPSDMSDGYLDEGARLRYARKAKSILS